LEVQRKEKIEAKKKRWKRETNRPFFKDLGGDRNLSNEPAWRNR